MKLYYYTHIDDNMYCDVGTSLPDEQITAEIGTFIMAGYETTAHTLSFTLFSIAAYSSVQSSICDELKSAGLLMQSGYLGRELQYDDIRDLSYLSSVLKESMRMFPVVAAFPRCQPVLLVIETAIIRRHIAAVNVFGMGSMCAGIRMHVCRVTEKTTPIGQYDIPKHTFVYLLFYSMHNSPLYWNHPETFNPQRWLAHGADYADKSCADGHTW